MICLNKIQRYYNGMNASVNHACLQRALNACILLKGLKLASSCSHKRALQPHATPASFLFFFFTLPSPSAALRFTCAGFTAAPATSATPDSFLFFFFFSDLPSANGALRLAADVASFALPDVRKSPADAASAAAQQSVAPQRAAQIVLSITQQMNGDEVQGKKWEVPQAEASRACPLTGQHPKVPLLFNPALQPTTLRHNSPACTPATSTRRARNGTCCRAPLRFALQRRRKRRKVSPAATHRRSACFARRCRFLHIQALVCTKNSVYRFLGWACVAS